MKKKTIIHITNWILLFSLPLMLLMVEVDTDTISAEFSTKNLATNLMTRIEQKPLLVEQKEEIVEEVEDEELKIENKENNNIEDTQTIQEVKEEQKEEIKKEEEKPAAVIVQEPKKPEVVNPLTTYTGSMSFYRSNCVGCSGVTASGYDISDGHLYYNDATYGNVRIVAAGSEIPMYSIIRLKNTSFGGDILAIKLDRGGDIGLGRRFLIDMLTNSSEDRGGVDRNITVEVVRSGR